MSVASPESGLLSDWSRNKKYLELSHNWFPVWQCDLRSKKFRDVMKSDDPSEESLKIMLLLRVLFTKLSKKVKGDHRSKFSNLSNWKEEA